MTKISLFCATHNPLKWEYPAREFIEYHAPFVDEIVVCDAESIDGWLDYLKTIPKVRVVNFNSSVIFEKFGQAGLQKAIAKEHCSHPYLIHLDIDTFLIGIEKISQLIGGNQDVDDFPIPVIHFYGSFYKLFPKMGGTDPYQHTIMKRDAPIGIGRSWPESDGSEFIYLPGPDDYKQRNKSVIYHGQYIRESPAWVMNVNQDFMCLYHYGWCCRSFNIMQEKIGRQLKSQEKEWGHEVPYEFQKEDSPLLVDFKGEHPKIIQDLIARIGGGWRFL